MGGFGFSSRVGYMRMFSVLNNRMGFWSIWNFRPNDATC